MQNAETLAKKKSRGVKLEIVTMTGMVQEVGIGRFYIGTADGEENFSSKAIAAVFPSGQKHLRLFDRAPGLRI